MKKTIFLNLTLTNMKQIFTILQLAFFSFFTTTLFAQTLPLSEPNLPSGSLYTKDGNDLRWLPGNIILRAGKDVNRSRKVTEISKPVTATHLEIVPTFLPEKPLHNWMAAVALAHRKNQVPPGLPVVAIYQVTYADSATINIPGRYQESIHNTFRVHEVGPMLWAEPVVSHTYDPKTGEKAVVYRMQWPNPRP